MPAANAKPHVSRALAHLRFGVTGAGVAVALATFLQLVVFGFVHFTDVRYTDLKPVQDKQQLSVISSSSLSGYGPSEAELPPVDTADVNRVRTGWDIGLDRLSGLAVTGGVVAALTLCLMCMLGVVVAGGGSVPGVERAVTATTWSVILAVLCLPIGAILNSTSLFPGVFGSYETMVASSSAVDVGQGSGGALFATYVFMPFAALGAALVIVLRFRSGIEMGIIPESLSEFDEMLEKEMATIRQRGVTASGGNGRAGTAMRQTMSDATPEPPVASEPVTMAERAPRKVEEPPEPAKRSKPGRAWVSANDRNLGEPNPGDPLKRPI